MPATLCIGADLAWWGGSERRRSSQYDHIWSGWIDRDGCIRDPTHNVADLRGSEVRNPSSWAPGSYRDPSGRLFLDQITKLIVPALSLGRMVVALDAPLEAAARPGELTRRRTYARGDKSGACQRECERALRRYLGSEAPGDWSRDVKIQAGAPLFPRVKAIVDALKDMSFSLGARGRPMTGRDLLEIFPSATIGVLGAGGAYGGLMSADARSYKRRRCFESLRMAVDCGITPLAGFEACLGPQVRWVAEKMSSVAVQFLSWKDGRAKADKGYDDVVDAGIAFLTGACAVLGQYQWHGDGSDGAILTPAMGRRC